MYAERHLGITYGGAELNGQPVHPVGPKRRRGDEKQRSGGRPQPTVTYSTNLEIDLAATSTSEAATRADAMDAIVTMVHVP